LVASWRSCWHSADELLSLGQFSWIAHEQMACGAAVGGRSRESGPSV
jgi:hypothetical protein